MKKRMRDRMHVTLRCDSVSVRKSKPGLPRDKVFLHRIRGVPLSNRIAILIESERFPVKRRYFVTPCCLVRNFFFITCTVSIPSNRKIGGTSRKEKNVKRVKQSVRYRDETQDADIITAWKRMEIVPTLK